MDKPRTGHAEKRRMRRYILAVIGLIVVVSITVGISTLEPAAPTVDKRHSVHRQSRARPDDPRGARPRRRWCPSTIRVDLSSGRRPRREHPGPPGRPGGGRHGHPGAEQPRARAGPVRSRVAAAGERGGSRRPPRAARQPAPEPAGPGHRGRVAGRAGAAPGRGGREAVRGSAHPRDQLQALQAPGGTSSPSRPPSRTSGSRRARRSNQAQLAAQARPGRAVPRPLRAAPPPGRHAHGAGRHLRACSRSCRCRSASG